MEKKPRDAPTILLLAKKALGRIRALARNLRGSSRTEPGFDAAHYLRYNPDVASSGVDPYQHYRLYGKMEGRLAAPLQLNCIEEFQNFDPAKDTILLVSHEASLTGAPVLSWNIAEVLSKRYNLIVLMLGPGPLLRDFSRLGATVVGPLPQIIKGPQIAESILDSILEQCDIKFAITNSIVSTAVSSALAGRFIPNVSLIHEFAAYTRPQSVFTYAALWAGLLVFSTRLTLESALREDPSLINCWHEVLPQGQCHLPPRPDGDVQDVDEKKALTEKIVGRSPRDNQIVVIGLGTVQLRKGVELFIAAAARIAQLDTTNNYRFVWIGHGYRPGTDLEYSAYLLDQIERSGLQQRLVILPETPYIDAVYRCADILLLSSRLDPLPNVAIDAMSRGMPIVCFDNTTGLADILKEHALGDACVAGYLDVDGMAVRAIAFARDASHREYVGNALQAVVRRTFDMHQYVAHLEALANSRQSSIERERKAAFDVLSSGLLDKSFSLTVDLQHLSLEQAANFHVRSWASNILRRKPFPGFHPGIYRAAHLATDSEVNPLAHYIEAGKPAGPWLTEVITAANPTTPIPAGLRLGLHIHVYYADLLPGILSALEGNTIRPDLLISVPSDTVRQRVEADVARYSGKVVRIAVVPNRGRDIGPMLTEFGSTIRNDYDIIGHLHTKKTADLAASAVGERWHGFLLANLLGGEHAMADRIIARMAADSTIGLVFPDDPNCVGWDTNLEYAIPLAKRLGILTLPTEFNFPVGTMLWARTAALAPILDVQMDWSDYPAEPLGHDGSILHALERLLPLVAAQAGMRSVVTRFDSTSR